MFIINMGLLFFSHSKLHYETILLQANIQFWTSHAINFWNQINHPIMNGIKQDINYHPISKIGCLLGKTDGMTIHFGR